MLSSPRHRAQQMYMAMSIEDRQALAIMGNTVPKVDGHYQIALPWRYQSLCLPNNRSMADRRLRLPQNHLKKDESLRMKYRDVIDDYIERGHARKVHVNLDEDSKDKPVWYLLHHPVVRPDKLRVVFDCSACYKRTSLNDQLLSGPDLTNSLLGVLIRFRQEPVAVMSDIKQIFHQVRVDPNDNDAFRFLWWPDGDLSKEPQYYQMLVHLFGATSSPSSVSYVLKKTATDNQGEFDIQMTDTLNRNSCVDDCLKSVPSVENALNIVQELPKLLERGGFHFTKWILNRLEVMSVIPEEERASTIVDLDLDKLPVNRALGVRWDVGKDKFGFKGRSRGSLDTRRKILSFVSSIHDPLGIVAPLLLPVKKFLQELCKLQFGSDDLYPQDNFPSWKQWLDYQSNIENLTVSRCLKPGNFGNLRSAQLYHFLDASEDGYGAISYLRLENTSVKFHCALLLGKSRVAPLKTFTIPRMELTAATVAINLHKLLSKELEIPVHQTVFWTDSAIVIQYIRNEAKRFQTFVANRLSLIHDVSLPMQWKYVPSELNPADHASREIKATDTDYLDHWLYGPSFLWKNECYRPQQPIDLAEQAEDDKEIKQSHHVHTVNWNNVMVSLVSRFSSWCHLQLTIAWLRRYNKSYLRSQVKTSLRIFDRSPLKVKEVLRLVQIQVFTKALELIKARNTYSLSKELSKTGYLNPLRKLDPVLVDGIIRVGGRIDKAPVCYDVRHPMILPGKHKVTALINKHYLHMEGYVGTSQVLTKIRQNFCALQGPAAVKRVVGECLLCKRWNSRPESQILAPLPDVRVTPAQPPFSSVGIDYFGPIPVKVKRSTVKRYGCVFTCLGIRAVHEEIAYDLSMDSFIQTFMRFVSRRGPPTQVFSDNGTNFRGAEIEIMQALKNWNQLRIITALRNRSIKWHFNLPAASHAGGVWERMICSIRKILRSIFGDQLVNDETLTYKASV